MTRCFQVGRWSWLLLLLGASSVPTAQVGTVTPSSPWESSVQGLCTGGGISLTNALDLVIGY
jgi:hypothetical protein